MTDSPTPHQMVASICDLLDADELPADLADRISTAMRRRARRHPEIAMAEARHAWGEVKTAWHEATAGKPEKVPPLRAVPTGKEEKGDE